MFLIKISFVYGLCVIVNKIRTKQTNAHAFSKIVGFMHWNCHYSFIMQKQWSVITQVQKNQSMGWTCIYLKTDTILFHLQIVCLIFYCLFSYKIRWKLLYPWLWEKMPYRFVAVFFKVRTSTPPTHALFRDRCVFSNQLYMY